MYIYFIQTHMITCAHYYIITETVAERALAGRQSRQKSVGPKLVSENGHHEKLTES